MIERNLNNCRMAIMNKWNFWKEHKNIRKRGRTRRRMKIREEEQNGEGEKNEQNYIKEGNDEQMVKDKDTLISSTAFKQIQVL